MLWKKRAHWSEIDRLLSGWVKIRQIPHVIFEITSQFFLNFASLFSFMRDNSSALFQLKLYMIWTKGDHESAKFQTFDCSREILRNLYFDRLLLLKVYKISAKKNRRVVPHDIEKWCKIWRKTDLLLQIWQEFGEIWPKHSKISKMCTLIGSFYAKYMTLDLKKYRGVIFHDNEEWCKIWRKTDL